MPLHEYRCKQCNHQFEFLAKSSTEFPQKCPKCGNNNPEKQLSTFNAAVPACGYSAGSSCATGSCPTGSCPTGTCPF